VTKLIADEVLLCYLVKYCYSTDHEHSSYRLNLNPLKGMLLCKIS